MAIAKKNGRTLSTFGSFAREGSKEEWRGEESSPLKGEALVSRIGNADWPGKSFETGR